MSSSSVTQVCRRSWKRSVRPSRWRIGYQLRRRLSGYRRPMLSALTAGSGSLTELHGSGREPAARRVPPVPSDSAGGRLQSSGSRAATLHMLAPVALGIPIE
jgi:predicted alpha/beta-hydrolase family hydrolase